MRSLRMGLAVGLVVLGSAGSAGAATVPGRYIVVLDDSANAVAVETKHEANGANIAEHYRHALTGYSAQMSASELAQIRSDPAVRSVSPVRTMRIPMHGPGRGGAAPQDPQELDTSVDRVDGEASSTQSGDGSGTVDVNVAVLDTGVDPRHPELNVAGGHNCVGGDPGAWQDDDAAFGHGTAVAGLIASLDNSFGEVGVAPGASVWAVKVFDSAGVATSEQFLCGVDWVTSTRLDTIASNDIAVANFSGGNVPGESDLRDDGNCGRTNGDPEHLAICRATAAGVAWVNAAGNDSQDFACCGVPEFDEVLTVTAIADYDGLPGGQAEPVCRPAPDVVLDDGADFGQVDDGAAFFSNFATVTADRAHTVAAPGACLRSLAPLFSCGPEAETCIRRGLYGTSFAAPVVTGTVALCIASNACAGLTSAQVVQKIVADARAYNLANPGYGFQGDPLRPSADAYYGYLVRAALY